MSDEEIDYERIRQAEPDLNLPPWDELSRNKQVLIAAYIRMNRQAD